MTIQLSSRQLLFLAGNTVIASSLVTLPQSLIDLALQNTWIVPIVISLYLFLLYNISLLGLKKAQSINKLFSVKNNKWKQKVMAGLFFLFIIHVVVRDVRVLSGFVETTLLPLTPLYIITMLIIISCLYIAWAGIEVIARFTELHFLIFIGVIIFLPLSLAGQIDVENFQPILGFDVIPSILQSAFVGFSWFGEGIVLFLIISTIKPLKHAKRSMIWGSVLGLMMFAVLIFCEIGVLGAEIIRYSTYPSYSLVQQVRITEFLDRIDIVLVTLYFPTIFSKIALFLYALHLVWSLLWGEVAKITMVPLALIIGILSIVIFETKATKFDFQVYTWPMLGLTLQVLIAILMIFFIREEKKESNSKENLKT